MRHPPERPPDSLPSAHYDRAPTRTTARRNARVAAHRDAHLNARSAARSRMSRHCARPGCNAGATATLSYDYANRVAWVDRLADEAHPMTHDLCERHADSLSVPKGWRLEDRRVVEPLFRERSYLAS